MSNLDPKFMRHAQARAMVQKEIQQRKIDSFNREPEEQPTERILNKCTDEINKAVKSVYSIAEKNEDGKISFTGWGIYTSSIDTGGHQKPVRVPIVGECEPVPMIVVNHKIWNFKGMAGENEYEAMQNQSTLSEYVMSKPSEKLIGQLTQEMIGGNIKAEKKLKLFQQGLANLTKA